MNITLSGTKVSMDGHTLAFQKNNLVDSMVITVDTDETWQYKLDVKYPCKDSNGKELYNIIDLTRVGNTCTAILQATMLPFNGKYTMQLRGISGNKVYHTDTFDVWVKYSIDPGKVYDPVPSEFYQIEQAVTEQAANAKQSASNAAESATKAENAAVHSPIVGENGNWFIWDFTKSEYVDSGKPASIGGGSDPSLGITGAQVGQIAKIMAVDETGKPTAWEAVDAASGAETWELIAEIDFDVDAANDVLVWEYKNLPNYKELLYRKVSLVGSTENASGIIISINNSYPQFSGIAYAKKGGQYSGWGKILTFPFGWVHINSGSANLPTNYAYGGLQTTYNAIPFDGDSITSVKLSAHTTYKIAGGKLSLYGRR